MTITTAMMMMTFMLNNAADHYKLGQKDITNIQIFHFDIFFSNVTSSNSLY